MARRKGTQFALYASPVQFRVWRDWAEAEGLSLTAWIRETLDAVVAADIPAANHPMEGGGEEVVRIKHKVVFSDER